MIVFILDYCWISYCWFYEVKKNQMQRSFCGAYYVILTWVCVSFYNIQSILSCIHLKNNCLHTAHPLMVYNSVGFSMFAEIGSHDPSRFGTSLFLQDESLWPPASAVLTLTTPRDQTGWVESSAFGRFVRGPCVCVGHGCGRSQADSRASGQETVRA